MIYGTTQHPYGERVKQLETGARRWKSTLVLSLGILPVAACSPTGLDEAKLSNSINADVIQNMVKADSSMILPNKIACAQSDVFNTGACEAIFEQAQIIHLKTAKRFLTKELCETQYPSCEPITVENDDAAAGDGEDMTAYIPKMDAILARPTADGSNGTDLNLEPLYVQQDKTVPATTATTSTHSHVPSFIFINTGGYGGYYSSPNPLVYSTTSGAPVSSYKPVTKGPQVPSRISTPPAIKAAIGTTPHATMAPKAPPLKISGPSLKAHPSGYASKGMFGNIGKVTLSGGKPQVKVSGTTGSVGPAKPSQSHAGTGVGLGSKAARAPIKVAPRISVRP